MRCEGSARQRACAPQRGLKFYRIADRAVKVKILMRYKSQRRLKISPFRKSRRIG